MKRTPIILLVVLIAIVALSLLLRANNSDNGTPTPTPTPVSPSPNPSTSTPTPPPASPTPSMTTTCTPLTVAYTNSGFSPNRLTLTPTCRTVTFVNQTSRNMWVASDPHPTHTGFPAFDADRGMLPGESYTFTFPAGARTYNYHDHLNAASRGAIVVQ